MKLKSRVRISAAVAAVVCATASLQARNLTWDADAETGVLGQDGGGNWDVNTTSNWVDGDLITGSNVVWDNTPGDNAIFGGLGTTFDGTVTPNNIEFSGAIQVQDVNVGLGANAATYTFSDFNGGSLTLNGNFTKSSAFGQVKMLLISGPLSLSTGDHTFAINDSPGDAAPELYMDGEIGGAGNIIFDNGPSYAIYGTTSLNVANSYTGTTTISKGRVIMTVNGVLGSTGAGTTIQDKGVLAIGGGGTTVNSGLTITEPITIKRDTYVGGEYEFGNYNAAFIVNGGTGNHTIAGPLVVDSTDARIKVNSSTLTISSNITTGSTVTNGVLSFTGDYAGFVQLTGDNTGLPSGGIKLVNAVEVQVTNDLQLGGVGKPITFAGDATLGIMNGFMTDFTNHPINTTDFSGGLDIPSGFSFNMTTTVTGGNGLGKRGLGTLNFDAPMTANSSAGGVFWDGGTVNVNNSVVIGAIHLRSPEVNINNGGVLKLTGAYSSIGQDSTGTGGGPDKAIININSGGQLISATGSGIDFNLSDNANTEGTINLHSGGTFSHAGLMHVGKSAGAKGTINQDGGAFNLTRNGNFTLVLGSRNGLGTYNLSGGTLTSAGEFYVGQGGAGEGVFNMSGGNVNLSNWFVVAREGGTSKGTVDISGGTFTQTGGNFSIGESGSANSLMIRNDAKVTSSGEAWFANGGGRVATAVIKDTAQFTNNNWFVVGRGGAFGTLEISGSAIVTKNGGGNAFVGESNNAITSTMTLKDNATFTDNSGEFWVGQAGGKGILTVQDNAKFTTNNWLALGRANGNSIGIINFSGGTFIKQGGNYLAIGSGGQGTFNQTGGVLSSSGTRLGEASSGSMNLTAGTATFTGPFSLGHENNLTGTLNIGGTAVVSTPDMIFGFNSNNATSGGVLNLNTGGTLTGNSFTGGANATAKRLFNFNGGVLKPASDQSNWIGAKITGVVSTGGAKFDSNGKSVNVNANMTHDAAVVGFDGGLNKTGAGTVTFSGNMTYTGPTTVQQGTMALGKSWTPSNTVTLSPSTTFALAPVGTQQVVLTVQPSTMVYDSTNQIDLNDNKMVFQGTTYGAVKTLIDTGRNGGNWDGPGYITSLTAAKSASQITTLAVADNALAGKTTFGGQSVSPTDILVMYTYNGDADLNGKVNADDYFVIDSNYNKGPTTAGFIAGDFNADGVLTGDDYFLIDTGYTGQGAPLQAAPSSESLASSGVSAVPEPASLGIVTLAAAGLLRRRRRNA